MGNFGNLAQVYLKKNEIYPIWLLKNEKKKTFKYPSLYLFEYPLDPEVVESNKKFIEDFHICEAKSLQKKPIYLKNQFFFSSCFEEFQRTGGFQERTDKELAVKGFHERTDKGLAVQ